MYLFIVNIPFILYIIQKLETKYDIIYHENINKRLIINNILSIFHSLYLSVASILYLINFISMDLYDIVIYHSIILQYYLLNFLLKFFIKIFY